MQKSSFRFTFKPPAESQRALIHQWLRKITFGSGFMDNDILEGDPSS